MRYLKMALIGLAGLSLLATCMGLLMPSSVKISRGVILEADSLSVAKMLMDRTSWKEWMPWMKDDLGVLVTFSGEQGIAGSSVRWRSLQKKNNGAIVYLGRGEGENLFRYQFEGMNSADGGFRIRSLGKDQTELQWFMEYPLRWYPWERFYGIFIDPMIGGVLEKGLQQLIQHLQKGRSSGV